ncbi:MAG: D-glycero-beta-D-manno-heptose 1-phosphate adenylyltransferase [Bacteroidetes bacterium]|nr:D-glycero-beta-D-manno-heptose 1-phosphate adenylyltransferase [Bacteroidota bacterium]
MISYQEIITRKIFSTEKIKLQAYAWQVFGKKIVFTNGCFDILHQGHVDYLCKARDMGDLLIVGLNTDASVKKQNKAPNRPINEENTRAFIIASLGFVDAVVLFDEDTPYQLIKTIEPDVLVKGADYKAEEIVGYDIVKARGGTVATIALTEGFSTTLLIEKAKK